MLNERLVGWGRVVCRHKPILSYSVPQLELSEHLYKLTRSYK